MRKEESHAAMNGLLLSFWQNNLCLSYFQLQEGLSECRRVEVAEPGVMNLLHFYFSNIFISLLSCCFFAGNA